MPVFTMNIPCTIAPKLSSDVYGVPAFSKPVRSLCAIVKLERRQQHTTVRADSGASRGHANEEVSDSILLLSKKVMPEFDSVISVRGYLLRVIGVRDRMDVMGRLDHYEVRCSIE